MNKINKLDERNNRTKQIQDLTPCPLRDLMQELCWRSLDRRNCPRFSWEAAPHHWPSVRGGILLSSHGTLNPQQPPFELPEQQQGALETWESQSCKHGLVLDPPLWFAWKLHVAQGSRGFAVRCDLGRKTCHSVWLRRSKGYDTTCLMLMTGTEKKNRNAACSQHAVRMCETCTARLCQSLVCSKAQSAALCRALRRRFMTLNSEQNARKNEMTEERERMWNVL